MDRTTWLTEERIDAPATGAPRTRRVLGGKTCGQAGFKPIAYGPGLVCGSAVLLSNHHAAMGHSAGNGTPLASRGAGFG